MISPVGSRFVLHIEIIGLFFAKLFRVRFLLLIGKGFAQCGNFVLLLPDVMEDEHRPSATGGVD